jgi:hypothetical protein
MLDNSAKTLGLTFPITLLDRADEVIERLVSFWHKGDIPTALTNVRFQGNRGHGVVGLRQSVSDPIQTAASPHSINSSASARSEVGLGGRASLRS